MFLIAYSLLLLGLVYSGAIDETKQPTVKALFIVACVFVLVFVVSTTIIIEYTEKQSCEAELPRNVACYYQPPLVEEK